MCDSYLIVDKGASVYESFDKAVIVANASHAQRYYIDDTTQFELLEIVHDRLQSRNKEDASKHIELALASIT